MDELLKASAKSRAQPADRLCMVENDDDRDRYGGEGGRKGGPEGGREANVI